MKTRIVCHRGACRHAPENTVAAGRAAARLGGDIVELDVRQSRDGVLYVLHDATLERTTDGHGPIAETHSATLDRLDAGGWYGADFAGEPLPRLDAFFAALTDQVDFYVEVKAADVEAVAGTIARAGLRERCFTYSENPAIRAALAEAAPWLKRMVNWRDLTELTEARATGAAILEFHAPDLRASRLEAARKLGLEIMVHTPHLDLPVFRTAMELGLEYLNIDHPEIAARIRRDAA
ncbi:glycerophosphodiester phosphodiesterase family protein [Psychromarinibacter sp. C21-152]|uniref:Glycerophosphodiester phosphodiesterase family protein n=1 Tax=Psychromarinibacter sediminicola TaxID=3033385 RepID=A0AAE3TBY9_9RHOB|nr:glycerophosphodiester phosphodiesterase family protein [Psychromarinibacter sediminicola]MDF0603100.1 glycerophosphodiester phosphodiesterase family protein [Psychromarinibacter sediminicola]